MRIRRARRYESEIEPETRTPGIFESGGFWLSLIPLFTVLNLIPQGAVVSDRLSPLGRSLGDVWAATASDRQSYLDGVNLPSDPFN